MPDRPPTALRRTPLSKKKPLPDTPIEAEIESLTHDGRGLTHVEGKAVFVHGALPGERVRFRYTRLQKRYDEGTVTEVLIASSQRVAPRCPHFGVCGGCSLQHMEATAQIGMKQEILKDVLVRIGKVAPETWLPPLAAGHWGYRRKARLGAKWVQKKGRVLVGFRERSASFITDLTRCETLHPAVGARLSAISELIQGLEHPRPDPSGGGRHGRWPLRADLPSAGRRPRRRTWAYSSPSRRPRACTSTFKRAVPRPSAPSRGKGSSWASTCRPTGCTWSSSRRTSPRSIWS